jgi:VWFA-related protein
MRNQLLITLFFLLLVVSARAQSPTATPTPRPENDVVKITTNLVQIDVTVTDKNGKVIRDLKPEEVEVYENGKKQDVTNFSFISNIREKTTVTDKNAEKPSKTLLPPTPVKPEQVRRTIALVVDDLSLSFESISYTRRALRKFVDEQMQDGDLVAIIRTGSGIGALQQFTNDKRQLLAAIEKVRWSPYGTGKIGAFAQLEATMPAGGSQLATNDQDTDAIEKEQESARTAIFASGTLGAIDYVVRGMAELPGRKSVMLISDGFPLFEEDRNGFRESGRVLDSLRRLVDAANRASVVIYTLDARGLVYTGLTAADNTSGRSADQIEQAMSDRRSQLFESQAGLQYLAQQTGGTALINSNDLSYGIRKILDDQSYYLVGFSPDEQTFDPKLNRFNKLLVKVNRPGAKVRYRSGFFGVTDEKMQALSQQGLTGRAKLFHALSSPFSVNQVPVRMNAVFNIDKDGGMFVRSLLHIDLKQIKFSDQPDGKKKAVIDILVVAFGDNGLIIDQSGHTYTLTLDKQQYEKYLKEGLVHIFTFPVKKAGAFQMRVAIRDTATDGVGSANQFIDVPNVKKDQLALSGIVLEDISVDEYNRRNAAQATQSTDSTAWIDTSNRQFKSGTVLNYGYSAFNVKPAALDSGNLQMQIRLFRDGQVIFEGKPKKVTTAPVRQRATDLLGSLMLGDAMTPGDYVLQITVTDGLAKPKHNSASQFVQFEVIP